MPILPNKFLTQASRNGAPHLLHAKQLKRNRKLSLNSASGYYSTFRGLLKIAYRDKLLKENVNHFLEKIEPKTVKKSVLPLVS